MANYSVKLVDHTQGSDKLRPLIQKHLQELFTEVFDGTSDSATVAWGAAATTDALVLHFVEDVASSYISQKMPGKEHRPDAGGFTRTQGGITGSEFYKFTVSDGERSQVKASAMARLAFHEAMHNKTGWSNDRLHGKDGGQGLAASPPGHTLTKENKATMQTAMANKNSQLQ